MLEEFKVELSDLTNRVPATSTEAEVEGTGVFDVLIRETKHLIQEEYSANRIKGSDYANVFLGSIQAVLQSSIDFLLRRKLAEAEANLKIEQAITEANKNKEGGIYDLERCKLKEEIDLIIAQTASQYESISASQEDTFRRNSLNNQDVLLRISQLELSNQERDYNEELHPLNKEKIETDIAATEEQITASKANTARSDTMSAKDLEVKDEQIASSKADTIRADEMHDKDLEAKDEQIDLLQSQDLEMIAGTIRKDNESAEKVLLLQAQTLGTDNHSRLQLLGKVCEGSNTAIAVTNEASLASKAFGKHAITDLVNNLVQYTGMRSGTPEDVPEIVEPVDTGE